MDIGEVDFEQPANEVAAEPEAKLPGILEYYVWRFRAARAAQAAPAEAPAEGELVKAEVRPLLPRKL